MASPPSLSRIGQKLRHYQLLELIGSGGMGEVYRAHDEHLDRDVAVKVLAEDALADDAARARFRHEALALSRLDHPCVATVYDFDTETVDFLVTEYVSGSRLEEKVRTGPLPEKEILELGMQLAEGVAAAHDRGVVHRDLKPSNLRLTSDGRLKILDFGLAVFPEPLSDASTVSFDESDHDVSGTVQYMSPEQLRGDPIDTRADIYGIGAVLYELAAGLPPFARTTLAGIFDGALHERPKPPRESNPDISDHLQQIILRCLEKQREHRYQTARDLLADLRRAVICAGDERAVAVLYFENLGQATDGEYFRDGITEDITTELTKIKDLRVFSRSAVLQFRDKPVSATSVGQQLNAAYLVEGSVRRDGERLRITAKLVETRNGLTRWAERYDRDLKDVFAIQDEIAQNIARELRLVLSDTEKSALRKVPTGNVRAYDFYLRGRHFLHQFRRKGLVLASEMFQKAIVIDPQYARAFAGLADCASFVYMYWESSQDYLEKADYASSKALQLDPDLAEAHASCGLAASLRKDYDKAQRGFDAAIRINPKLYEPYYFAGRTCYAQGKLEEAVRWFDQASRVNPEDYQSRMLMGSALHGLKRFAEAKPTFENAVLAVERHLDVYPDDSRALYFGAIGLTQLEQRERAIEWARRATELEPDEKLVLYNIACVYALLGELDSAIACLERSITLGWDLITWMTHDPDLANLRNHPRFIALTGVSARP